jgi:2-hydroxychromene-2-carboxylate isomerase
MAAPTLDFWFEFGSTYSYPAAMRIGALAAETGVEVRLRPFLLGPIFQAQGWNTSPFNLYPAKGRHMWRDLERICAELSLPFRRPELFPQSVCWRRAWRWSDWIVLQARRIGRRISAAPSIAPSSPRSAASISRRRSAIFCPS